jgi:hypothetical protein
VDAVNGRIATVRRATVLPRTINENPEESLGLDGRDLIRGVLDVPAVLDYAVDLRVESVRRLQLL